MSTYVKPRHDKVVPLGPAKRSFGNLAGQPPMGLKGEKQRKAKRQRAEHSGAVRKSAKGEECTLRLPCCARDPATTIFAHLRLFGAGGTGLKPADFAGIYACHLCHDALDRRDGATAGLWGFEDVLRALMETHRRLHAKGLLHIG